MNPKFRKLVSEVERLHRELMAMALVKRDNLGACNYPGVYLFSERRRHLYCGRTKRPLNMRLLEHARPSVSAAPFAFRLARKKTGKLKASYKDDENSRKKLMKNPVFAAGPTTQALLEIYTATVLGTPQNEFKTT
jgi:hypothetical protein